MKAPRISIAELKAKLEGGEDVLPLDVRNPTDYAASDVKLPGAVRMPDDELDMRSDELDRSSEVVAYCT
jgi:rhodanese-related sulfurtransferase